MIRVLIWKKACIVLFIKRIISCCSIYKEAWYHVVLFIKRLDIMLSEFCPDICPWADIAVALRCLRMGKIDVITYEYVITVLIFVSIRNSRWPTSQSIV